MEHVDLGVVIALEEEFGELIKGVTYAAEFDAGQRRYYYRFDIGTYSCMAIMVGRMGEMAAALATQALVARNRPATLAVVGIAGALHDDLKLGDVFIAEQIDRYLEVSKVVNAQAQGAATDFRFQLGGEAFRPHGELIAHVRHLRTAHPGPFNEWLNECRDRMQSDMDLSRLLMTHAALVRAEPKVSVGHLASGPAVGASSEFSKWLRDHKDRNYKAIEMETGGVAEVVHDAYDVERMLAVRGISDLADDRKKELDGVGGGAVRRYAMVNAVSYLWTLLKAGVLPHGPR